jgi:hypothetical protein
MLIDVIMTLRQAADKLEELGYERTAIELHYITHDLELKLHGTENTTVEFPDNFE